MYIYISIQQDKFLLEAGRNTDPYSTVFKLNKLKIGD